MQRRKFIKSTICIGCLGLLACGCKNTFVGNQLHQDKFVYKSKKDLPKKIHLEACSMCQLNCPECGTRIIEKQMPKDWLGYLRFKDFKNFVDDNNLEEIELSNRGEIFLNPEFDEIIKYAYKKDVKLTANIGVNLNTVSNTTLENLVKYQFKRITVAIDGATPEIYSIYRRGGDFNKVINNIKKINHYKEKYNSKFPKLTWQFIPFGHNEHEIELAKKKAGELGMDIKFKSNWSPHYSPVKNRKLVEKQTGLKIIQNDKELITEGLDTVVFACNLIFNSPQIEYNGDLLGCCQYRDFGVNVFKEGLFKALNSPDFIYAKHMLTDLTIEPKQEIPCANCERYIFLKKNNIALAFK